MDNNLTIVILNYNNYKMSMTCIDNLIKLKIKYKIVVVDNKSTNESFIKLKEKYKSVETVTVVSSEKNKGYGYGNNYALKNYVDSKNVCIMNPDIEIKNSNIFDKLIFLKEKYKVEGITCLQNLNGEFSMETLGWKLPTLKDVLVLNSYLVKKIVKGINYKKLQIISNEDNVAYIDVLPGCFFIMDYFKFKSIDFFDEKTFLYYEENIVAKKCKDKNYKFIVSLENFYIHNHKEKDLKIKCLKNKYKDRKIIIESQKIYCENYLHINVIQKNMLKLSGFINLNISLPIIHVLKKLLGRI